ncbi:MAG: hypothetical protein MK080_09495 [Opitutales bacterium]|nr:hypothetical protein [Opitutales bacterium]
MGSLRSERALDLQYRVGDVISAQRLAGRSVIAPDGSATVLEPGSDLILNEPGVYRLRDRGGVLREFAVNVDPQESRTAVLDGPALAAVGLSERQFPEVEAADAETTISEEAVAEVLVLTEQTQRLWKLILWIVLGLFVLEVIWSRNLKPRTA